MKVTKGVAAVLALLALAVPAPADFLYVASDSPSALYGFRVHAGTGKLTILPGVPLSLDTGGNVVVAPAGPFAYVVGGFPSLISGFVIDPASGSLTRLPGSPFPLGGTGPIDAAIDGSSRFLYVADNLSGNISGYAISPSGQLSPTPGVTPSVGEGVQSNSLAADPRGRFLSVIGGDDNLHVFRIDGTGALTAIAGAPFRLARGGNTIAADPSGRFLYVVNETTERISAFAVGVTGTPTAIGNPIAAGERPISIGVDARGRFVFVGNFLVSESRDEVTGAISVFAANATTGALSPAVGSPFATGPYIRGFVSAAGGRDLYVADLLGPEGPGPRSMGGVWGHRVDEAGFLRVTADTPVSAGRHPGSMAVLTSADIQRVCGGVKGDGSVSGYPRSRFTLWARLRAGREPGGRVSYQDRATHLTFHSTRVDSFVLEDGKATIEGEGRANGTTTVQYHVEATDGPDGTFTITLSSGETATGAVRGGMILIGQGCSHPTESAASDATGESR